LRSILSCSHEIENGSDENGEHDAADTEGANMNFLRTFYAAAPAGILILLLAVLPAGGGEELTIEQIQRAIAEQGAAWEARETFPRRSAADCWAPN
jgi:hypothetical protein